MLPSVLTRRQLLLASSVGCLIFLSGYGVLSSLLQRPAHMPVLIRPSVYLVDSVQSADLQPMNEPINYTSLIDSFFTEEQQMWLEHYKPERRRERGGQQTEDVEVEVPPSQRVQQTAAHLELGIVAARGGQHTEDAEVEAPPPPRARQTGAHLELGIVAGDKPLPNVNGDRTHARRRRSPLLPGRGADATDGATAGAAADASQAHRGGGGKGAEILPDAAKPRATGVLSSVSQLVAMTATGSEGARTAVDVGPSESVECSGTWAQAVDGLHDAEHVGLALRVALRSARSTWLSASMDREKVGQGRFLGHSELFALSSSSRGSVCLRSAFGRFVSVWYDGTVHQNTKCGAWETLRLQSAPGGRIGLRTAHRSFVSAADDERTLSHAQQLDENERWQLVPLRLPVRPASGFNVRVVLRGSWRHRGCWCVEWLGTARPDATAVARLCHNASSGTEYVETRGEVQDQLPEAALEAGRRAAEQLDAVPAALWHNAARPPAERPWRRLGEQPLCVRAAVDFELVMSFDKQLFSYALVAGSRCSPGWRSVATTLTLLQLQFTKPLLRSYGAVIKAVTLTAQSAEPLALLPAFELASMKSLQVSGAPASFFAAQAERGAPRFRLYNPSLVSLHDGIAKVVAKVSSYHLCGASDDYYSHVRETAGDLLSFVVTFKVQVESGALVGAVHALVPVNERLTRHQKWGDGPEDPRGLRIGGKEMLLLWARAWKPEYAVYAAVGKSVTRLQQVGCEACAQKNWLPLAHHGDLLVEQSIEPHVVLRIDLRTGLATPLANSTSFEPAARLQADTGVALHGGPPSLRLRLPEGRQVFLGLAHFNRLLNGKHALRVYYHIFYLFAARPPFELLGLGRPFMFPSEIALVQFASGMLLLDNDTLLVSFGDQDCEARRATISLSAALADTLAAAARQHPRLPAKGHLAPRRHGPLHETRNANGSAGSASIASQGTRNAGSAKQVSSTRSALAEKANVIREDVT